jgi:hypothetical protein
MTSLTAQEGKGMRPRTLLLVGMLACGAVACGGQSGTPAAVLPRAQLAADDGRVAALEQRLSTLEAQVKGINDSLGTAWLPVVKQLQDDVSNLSGSINTVNGTMNTDDAAVSQLQQDVRRLKTSMDSIQFCLRYPGTTC